MSDETTTGLAELWNSLGLDIVVGLIEIGNDAVVADCRPGLPLPETDFADQNTWQFQNVFGVACGPLKRATLCAILFRKRDALERFWAENPKLKEGLVTRWTGMMILWIRVAGVVPR